MRSPELREECLRKLARARILLDYCAVPTELWLVRYADGAQGVAIVGHAISRGAIDVWRSQGTRCKRICHVTRLEQAP